MNTGKTVEDVIFAVLGHNWFEGGKFEWTRSDAESLRSDVRTMLQVNAAPDGAQAVVACHHVRVPGLLPNWVDGPISDDDAAMWRERGFFVGVAYTAPPSQDAEDAARYRWLRDRALYFDRQEDGDSREGTPYCVYGLDMGDATPTFGKELDAFVDDCMTINAARAARGGE